MIGRRRRLFAGAMIASAMAVAITASPVAAVTYNHYSSTLEFQYGWLGPTHYFSGPNAVIGISMHARQKSGYCASPNPCTFTVTVYKQDCFIICWDTAIGSYGSWPDTGYRNVAWWMTAGDGNYRFGFWKNGNDNAVVTSSDVYMYSSSYP